MVKKTLHFIALIFLIVSAWFIYQWLISEPDNREPLPALLTLISTIIVTVIAWQTDGNKKDKLNVERVKKSLVDIDHKEDTDIHISNIKGNSKVLINKGKDSLKDNSRQ